MDNFSSLLMEWEQLPLDEILLNCTESDVQSVLQKDNLNPHDFLTLLSPASNTFLEEMAQKANLITRREFGRTVQLYTPLYLSNYCKNRCTYCGFNEKNSIKRSKLNTIQMRDEAERILKLGIKHILLLTGGDRVNTPFSYIRESVIFMKKYFESISIEMYAMSEREYKELHELGVDNITIYQETYNRTKYEEVHLSGEKSAYDFRLEAPERAARAGLRSVNLGVLLGLGEPVKDFFKAGLHSWFIRQNYPGCDVAISLPRIKDAVGMTSVHRVIEDREMVKFILAYRLFLTRGGISISTRESRELRDNLLPLGVTKMSAQSKTSVGENAEEQFSISDERSVMELHSDLIKMDYQPVYKDWVIV